MCPPLIVPALAFVAAHAGTIAAVSTVGSTILGVAGARASGQAQQNQLTYQSQLDQINATAADHQAADAIKRGEEDAVALGHKVAQTRGAQIAQMGAMGLDLGYGTPLDIQRDTSLGANADARRVAENASREADSYRISAANYRADAVGAAAQRKAVGVSTMINEGSTLLNGASQLAGFSLKYGRAR